MTNRLAEATSPYLLQHAANPVHWQPWDEQALTSARIEGKPILLSIGYSACHWCHVMAHESFEDPAVAEVMNRLFVNIKVDREERPDLDHIYQAAHQMLTGRPGGWPLTLFMTPDGTPFFAGTYFPKTPRLGLPSFPELCERIADIHRNRAADIAEQNLSLREALAATLPRPSGEDTLDSRPVEANLALLIDSFDRRFGGFGAAPKFPHATDLAFLLRHADDDRARHAALTTLTRMAEGGLYDQLGGGFYRYSVDERWEIPHFEKMLYDNALLIGVYSDAWALTGEPLFARVAEDTVAWSMREMQVADGAFASSLDADSQGEEGRYYLWQPDEVRARLTADEWHVAARHWGLDGPANFENERWHLRVALATAPGESALLASARAKLLLHREQRVHPGCDDKVLTAWNALMIEGLAHAARIFDRSDWRLAARRALTFVRTTLWRDGRLLATWRDGKAHLPAYLDDHAFLLAALIEMLQADRRADDLEFAQTVAETLLRHFEDRHAGGFHFTADDHETLIHRSKPAHDNATPAGNAVAARALQHLGRLIGDTRYLQSAERTLALFRPQMTASGGVSSLVMALEDALMPMADGVNVWVCSDLGCRAPTADLDTLRPTLPGG